MDTSLKLLHLSAEWLGVITIMMATVGRAVAGVRLPKVIRRLNWSVMGLVLVVSVVLAVWDYVTPANVVFEITHLQYTQMLAWGVVCLVAGVAGMSDEWYRKHYKMAMMLGSVVALGLVVVIASWPFNVFRELSKEDHIIENLQVAVLILGACWSFLVSRRLRKRGNKWWAVAFGLVMMGFVFVAGEEMSWGQRVLGIKTPEVLRENNDQDEMTLHNLHAVGGAVNTAYILVGGYGSVAWVLSVLVPKLKKSRWKLVVPPWYVSGYFWVGFYYNLYTRIYQYHHVGQWSETAELFLYTGATLTLLVDWLEVKKKREMGS